ncbi:MAG: hypothetical protein J7J61_06910 [Candidatus Hydrothermae bacterium]|nr:hypothetical protein [Candidatus Hydrothermae bacterium]
MISLEALYQKLKQLFQEGVLKVDVSGSDMATETTLSSINGKITKADTDNVKVVDEVAYDSTNDRKKVSIENDAVGLAKDATLQTANTTLSGIKTQTDKMQFDSNNSLLTERITGQSGLRGTYTVPSGAVFQIPEYETVIISGDFYADGDVYAEGVLEVI